MSHFAQRQLARWRRYVAALLVCLVVFGLDSSTTTLRTNAQSIDPTSNTFLPIVSDSPERSGNTSSETPVTETPVTETSTVEPTETATSEPTATATSEPTATATSEPTATATSESTATATSESTATATPEPTATQPTELTVRVERSSESNSTIESLAQPVLFRIERVGDAVDVEVAFVIDGSSDPALASVSADDLLITTDDGTTVTDRITIPAARDAMTVSVQAVADTLIEVPEVGSFALQAGDGYVIAADAAEATFFARDKAAELTTESRIFVATLVTQNGADTNATGLATVRLYDDNHLGLVNVSFSGLTSPEIAAHIHEATTDNIIFSLPLGQVNNREWPIAAADPLLTNQAMLDALLAGQLYINIHTADYPDGEILGMLMPSTGSVDMQTPDEADPIEELTAAELQQDIARFLTQTTFGATPDMVADLEARIGAKGGDRIAAYGEWIDEQTQIDSPSLLAFHNAYRPMYKETDPAGDSKFPYLSQGVTEGWFTSAVYSKAQFRERIGFALSEIFVVSLEDSSIRHGAGSAASYYDMLRRNAFGTYQELLTGISTHPAMGWYLSHFQNQMEQRDEFGEVITSPDENYAREIMQLFSIGLVELHPNGSLKLGEDGLPIRTYSQDDITEMARVFTGWGMSVYNPDDGMTTSVAPNENFNFTRHSALLPYHPYWGEQMKMFEDNGFEPDHRRYLVLHDNGAKTVLGTTIPADLSGEADLEQVMSLLSNHSNTAPFISYRLIQRLVTSNPSPDYLYRVSTVFAESGGDLTAVLKAILLDPEARNLSNQAWDGYGKKKEPLVHFTAMLRLIQAYSSVADTYPLDKLTEYGMPASEMGYYEDGVEVLYLSSNKMADGTVGFEQAPLRAPNVFNWFQPNFAPVGIVSSAGLVAPELQIATENQVMSYYNTFYDLLLTDGLEAGEPQAKMDRTPVTYAIPQWLIDTYTSAMDPSDPAAVRNATKAVVDSLDLYLCGGRLQANSAGIIANRGADNDPYTISVDGLAAIMAALDDTNELIREALFLIGTTPDCLVQQ